MGTSAARTKLLVRSPKRTDRRGWAKGHPRPPAITAAHAAAETSTSGINGATLGRPDDGRADDGHGLNL